MGGTQSSGKQDLEESESSEVITTDHPVNTNMELPQEPLTGSSLNDQAKMEGTQSSGKQDLEGSETSESTTDKSPNPDYIHMQFLQNPPTGTLQASESSDIPTESPNPLGACEEPKAESQSRQSFGKKDSEASEFSETTTDKSSHTPTMATSPVGACVELKELSQSNYNGMRGLVKQKLPNGRFHVELENGDSISVKPEKCEFIRSKIIIIVIGRTGDGKSTLCNSVLEVLGESTNFFSESASAFSHTHKPEVRTVESPNSPIITIMDTPGLMDSAGEKKDEENIKLIVEAVRACNSVHSFILAVNEQVPRFDEGMQDAVRLFVDSFGANSLNHMGIMFTKALGQEKVGPNSNQKRTEEIVNLIERRTGIEIKFLPFWRCDAHPEEMARYGVPPDKIDEFKRKKQTNIQDMVRWSKSKKPFDTTGSVIGKVSSKKRERENDEYMQSILAQAEEKIKKIKMEIEAEVAKLKQAQKEYQAFIEEQKRQLDEQQARLQKDSKVLEEEQKINQAKKDVERLKRELQNAKTEQKAWEDACEVESFCHIIELSDEVVNECDSDSESSNLSDDDSDEKHSKLIAAKECGNLPITSNKAKKASPSQKKQVGWTRVRGHDYPVFEGREGGQYFVNQSGNRSYLWSSKQTDYRFAKRKKDL